MGTDSELLKSVRPPFAASSQKRVQQRDAQAPFVKGGENRARQANAVKNRDGTLLPRRQKRSPRGLHCGLPASSRRPSPSWPLFLNLRLPAPEGHARVIGTLSGNPAYPQSPSQDGVSFKPTLLRWLLCLTAQADRQARQDAGGNNLPPAPSMRNGSRREGTTAHARALQDEGIPWPPERLVPASAFPRPLT